MKLLKTSLAVLLLCSALVGCSQGEGDRCEVSWDCGDGLSCCSGSWTCQKSCTGSQSDASVYHDAEVTQDASP